MQANDCIEVVWLPGIGNVEWELTAGLNWRTTRRASSSAWYSTMPTLLCDFTMSQRRCLPAARRTISPDRSASACALRLQPLEGGFCSLCGHISVQAARHASPSLQILLASNTQVYAHHPGGTSLSGGTQIWRVRAEG